MSVAHDRVLAVLGRHLSSINAQNLLGRALRDARLLSTSISDGDVRRLQPSIERGLRLFLPMTRVSEVVAELNHAFVPTTAPGAQLITIRTEDDISEARSAARVLCDGLGARRVVIQKVATVVSELARNIYMYTNGKGGTVELIPSVGTRPRLRICAVDEGPGIDNLEVVLGGRYRSRTGLGAGLLGTKRLVEKFTIETGPTGTRIDVEVDL